MKTRSFDPISLLSSAYSIMQRDIFIYALNILTGVIVARTLGPEILGIWVLLTLVSSYAEGFGRLKTDISSVYILGSEKAKPEEVLFSITFFAVITSFTIVSIMLWQIEFIEDFLFQNTKLDYRQELICIIFIIPFEFLLLNYSYFYISLENVVVYNRIKVIQAILNFSIIAILILALDFKLWSLVFAKIISTLIPLLYSWSITDRRGWTKLRSRWNWSVSKDILTYAFNFYIIGIIGHIHRLTIKTIGAISFNTSQLAFYNQGEAASRLLNVIPNALSTILYPRISRSDEAEQSIEISCTSFRVTFFILSIVGVILFLIADYLIIFLYGIDFAPTADVLEIALPGAVIGSSCLTLQTFFQGKGLANIIPKLQIIPVILQVGFAYIFISLWGLNGAAMAFSLGSALYGLVILIAFIWINHISISRLIPKYQDIKLVYSIVLNHYKKD